MRCSSWMCIRQHQLDLYQGCNWKQSLRMDLLVRLQSWGPMAWLSRVAWGLWSGAFESIYFHINCIVVKHIEYSTALNCIVMLHHMYIKSFFYLRSPSSILQNSINMGPLSSFLQLCGKAQLLHLWVLEVSLKKVMTTLWV